MGAYTRSLKRVQSHFVPQNLIDICESPMHGFDGWGKLEEVGGDHFYIHQDNGASILGIAHLDTVQDVNECNVLTTKSGAPVVFSPALDDRLGAYVILDLLPRLDVKIDWLLTTGEETGSSTGEDFARDHLLNNGKQYNWMFQFDRMGTDVVAYDYDTPYLRSLLKSVGYVPAHGSFSDICSMETMGCLGFNVGVGYLDYHSKRAHAWLDDTFSQVARFLDFYRRYGNRLLPFERRVAVWEWRTFTTASGKDHSYRTKIYKLASEVTRDDELDYYGDYDITGRPFGSTPSTFANSQERDWGMVRDKWLSEHGTTRYLTSREVRAREAIAEGEEDDTPDWPMVHTRRDEIHSLPLDLEV